jgi:hypothetical protein
MVVGMDLIKSNQIVQYVVAIVDLVVAIGRRAGRSICSDDGHLARASKNDEEERGRERGEGIGVSSAISTTRKYHSLAVLHSFRSSITIIHSTITQTSLTTPVAASNGSKFVF